MIELSIKNKKLDEQTFRQYFLEVMEKFKEARNALRVRSEICAEDFHCFQCQNPSEFSCYNCGKEYDKCFIYDMYNNSFYISRKLEKLQKKLFVSSLENKIPDILECFLDIEIFFNEDIKAYKKYFVANELDFSKEKYEHFKDVEEQLDILLLDLNKVEAIISFAKKIEKFEELKGTI